MTELSPAVQAVMDAFTEDNFLHDWKHNRFNVEALAAALRAAADQVVPQENVDEADYDCLHSKWVADGKQETRRDLLAIAAELEVTSELYYND